MFVSRKFEDNHVGFVTTALLDSYNYNIIYRVILFVSLQYVLPTLALVYLNARVIVALRRSDAYRLSTAQRYPSQPVTSHPPEVVTSSTRSITVVVAVIVTICIVVHVIALTAHVITTVQVRSYLLHYKKDGYRQRNVRQFLQSAKAHYLATSRESRRYVVAFSRIAGGSIWLRQESLRHILASPGYAPGTIAVNVTWIERGFNAC